MIYSFLYVLVFSIALVLIQKLDVNIPPLFSLLITAIIASVYFNMINRKYLIKTYKNCFQNKIQWFLVMSIVLVMWASTMIGPGKIGASFFNFIYFAWLGILGFVSLSIQNWEKYQAKFYLALCFLILIIINIFFELKSSFYYETIIGIVLALIGGTSSFVYFKKSQTLAKNAVLSATQVLAVRFYLAIFILFSITPRHNFESYLTLSNIISLVALAFFSLIIPLYFSQKALEKISSEQHAIINSLCPIITGILQEIVFNDIKIEQLIIYCLYTFSITMFYFINKTINKMELAK